MGHDLKFSYLPGYYGRGFSDDVWYSVNSMFKRVKMRYNIDKRIEDTCNGRDETLPCNQIQDCGYMISEEDSHGY